MVNQISYIKRRQRELGSIKPKNSADISPEWAPYMRVREREPAPLHTKSPIQRGTKKARMMKRGTFPPLSFRSSHRNTLPLSRPPSIVLPSPSERERDSSFSFPRSNMGQLLLALCDLPWHRETVRVRASILLPTRSSLQKEK